MDTLTFREPRLVALALLVIIAAGLSAFLALGRQEDPTITNINAVVTTPYPGASPERVESLVTRPLEEELREIPEINVIESTSSTGVSILSLELDETVDPALIEGIWSEARDAVSEAERNFPAGALAPEFESDNFGAVAAILALRPSGETASPVILTRYAEEMAERLRGGPGTKSVTLFGEPEEEVLVRIDPTAAAALGLSPDAISAAITAGDAKVQSGRFINGETDLLLDVTGDIEATDRIANIVLAGNGSSTVTRLGDIADISRGPRAPPEAYALSEGKPAVLLSVKINDGLRIDQWQACLEEDLATLRADLPA